jgi:Na+-translocating ferredoxin:NAD+ oxidoreductase RnfG subunit
MKIITDIIRPVLVFTAVVLACVLLLSIVQGLTGPVTLRRAVEKRESSLSLVLPGFTVTASRKAIIEGADFSYWEAEKKEGTTTMRGFAFITKSAGYGGDVESMVGVDENGRVLGLSIINQSESPGTGGRCVEVAGRETLWERLSGGGIPESDLSEEMWVPWFQNQFKGLDANTTIGIVKLGDWTPGMRKTLIEKNAISALTGASITTAAVVRGIEAGMRRLKKAREMPEPVKTGGAG